MSKSSGWIGVDLDGTLAEYHGWSGVSNIGKPIEPMVQRIKAWLAAGRKVKIFTARVASSDNSIARKFIEEWCQEVFGVVLPVTCQKDMSMIELWDDRAIQVIFNTGARADGVDG